MRVSKPQGDLRSLSWKARTKAARRLLAGSPDEYDGDDFDWSRYHLEYAEQIRQLETIHTLKLVPGAWEMHGGSLEITEGLPLHANHKKLYETILALSPSSVLEAGCGGGDHLHNLSRLLPEADIQGIDRSSGQLETLRRRNADFKDNTRVVDLTLPHPTDIPKADLVFVQAVLMHIQTGNGHRVALWNLFDLAERQVVMVENLERHDLISDIRDLWSRRILPWSTLHLYATDPEASPRFLVASKEPTSLGLREVPLP